jgi:hypothetical protein
MTTGDPILAGQVTQASGTDITQLDGSLRVASLWVDDELHWTNCAVFTVSAQDEVVGGLSLTPETVLIATLYDLQTSLTLLAVTPDPGTESMTIHLSRTPDSPVRVGVLALFGP